ncbi:altronate hydrolase [Sphingomonas sp. S17]|jgi:altronate hydrolase|uniref:GarD protein n=2 Tax=Sphingomonas paucimobilis TaxID=13689 RepID=A0A0C9NKM1_SPHPI|nr:MULTISPECIES: UxaA family hydrolase [Sphingomonas]EGI55795.1 altronate hydrolase [Sphingomonas sp. S17]MCM3679618.1 UxaA family hydrolase [Sphingomonas paucimobilis]MDG5970988.1 UxaA family hydrolase [Sphingomonas paucimobilis]SUJ06137.1 D-galactarate dehydratase [Sphingomonas paucimobilis]BCI72728.1 hydrolase [Sphingomonas paucimobilis]
MTTGMTERTWQAWARPDGRKGIRDAIVVVYLVECAHHVARRIVDKMDDPRVQLIGFPGCYPNDYALAMMKALTTHPNVGGVVLLSLGCESFNREALAANAREQGRPVETIVIQQSGGTRGAMEAGIAAVERVRAAADAQAVRVPMTMSELVIGTICGGSDGTSGITGNPAVGRAFDTLVDAGAVCIFEETGEMIGCEGHMAERAATPEVADALIASVAQAERYYRAMGYGSFAPGNAEGGLSSQEEKSAGAYAKSGSRAISGVILPAEQAPGPGLYLLDVVPPGDPKFGFPNIVDNAEIGELIACGAHINLFVTGRGSVVGSAISPVIKVAANPEMYARMEGDMDVNAGRILYGDATLDAVGEEIVDLIVAVSNGAETKSEALGHQEFVLTYKASGSNGPSCLPRAA